RAFQQALQSVGSTSRWLRKPISRHGIDLIIFPECHPVRDIRGYVLPDKGCGRRLVVRTAR
ncbi:MAG: hypothetical protein ACPIE8_03330, partial [Henriciella sp.]